MSVSETASNTEPPSGSVITVVDTADGKGLVWQPPSRHPIQWFVAGIGGLCVLTTLFIMVMFLADGLSAPKGMPDGVAPFDNFGPLEHLQGWSSG